MQNFHKEQPEINKHTLQLINKKVLQEFQKQLLQILKKIQTEDFTQTEDLKICEWCDYKLICNR